MKNFLRAFVSWDSDKGEKVYDNVSSNIRRELFRVLHSRIYHEIGDTHEIPSPCLLELQYLSLLHLFRYYHPYDPL